MLCIILKLGTSTHDSALEPYVPSCWCVQTDPSLSRTVMVSTKLDTRIPQFARGEDVELFLHPPGRLLEPGMLGGSPFYTCASPQHLETHMAVLVHGSYPCALEGPLDMLQLEPRCCVIFSVSVFRVHRVCSLWHPSCPESRSKSRRLPMFELLLLGRGSRTLHPYLLTIKVDDIVMLISCRSVPSGRVGNAKDAVFRSNEAFREAVHRQESSDVEVLEHRLDRRMEGGERARVGVSQLRRFLEQLLQRR